VPRTGFEPAHLTAPPPEDGASTNFATWAFWECKRNAFSAKKKFFLPLAFLFVALYAYPGERLFLSAKGFADIARTFAAG
jgi:hypothetical protein